MQFQRDSETYLGSREASFSFFRNKKSSQIMLLGFGNFRGSSALRCISVYCLPGHTSDETLLSVEQSQLEVATVINQCSSITLLQRTPRRSFDTQSHVATCMSSYVMKLTPSELLRYAMIKSKGRSWVRATAARWRREQYEVSNQGDKELILRKGRACGGEAMHHHCCGEVPFTQR